MERPITQWSGADLARAIHRAVMAHPSARRLPDTEREAIGQEVALRVFRGKGLERVAREYLARTVSTVLESRGWQDTAARYLSARERQADTGPMVTPVGDALDIDAVGVLTASLDPTAVDISPLDVQDLARLVADRLDTDPVNVRRLRARLVQAMAGDHAPEAMAALALSTGRTLNACRIDATRAVMPDLEPADLLALVRDVARAEGLAREADTTRPDLSAESLAAAAAVSSLARAGGAWDERSIRSGRSLPEWPAARPPVDAAPFPSVNRPGIGAMRVRLPYRPNGIAPSVLPERPKRQRWTPAAQDALYARSFGVVRPFHRTERPVPAMAPVRPAPATWQASNVVGLLSPVWDTDRQRWTPADGALTTADL